MKQRFIGKSLAAGLVLAASSLGAQAAPEFVVEECALGCGGLGTFQTTADRIVGGYEEAITTTLVPGTSQPFITSGILNYQGYELGGSPVANFVNSPVGYGLYALFQFEGMQFLDAGTGELTFEASTASIQIWGDPDVDSTATQNDGSAFPTISNGGDDVLLLSSMELIIGEGNGRVGLNNGDFEIVLDDSMLTAAGQAFFVDPDPFYMIIDAAGNFTDVNPAFSDAIGVEQTFIVTGAVTTEFAIPEPGVIALLASGMLGFGAAARRRRKQV